MMGHYRTAEQAGELMTVRGDKRGLSLGRGVYHLASNTPAGGTKAIQAPADLKDAVLAGLQPRSPTGLDQSCAVW